MSRRIVLRPQVPDDLDEIAIYLEQTSIAIADRFLTKAFEAFDDLADMPGKGSLKWFRRQQLRDIRSWAVPGFPNHLIYYHATDETIVILAVVHGAQNIPVVLKDRLE
jgi:plasmid stabilization system protein ParE